MRAIVLIFMPVITLAVGGLSRAGNQPAPSPAAQPHVVEMFLSQACPACPPAADYLTELAARGDVIALAWHVDYWDAFTHPRKGMWKDTFAHRTHTDRQEAYNRRIRGKSRNFTPQAVINGQTSLIASKWQKLERALGANNPRPEDAPVISFSRDADGVFARVVDAAPEDDALLVYFHKQAETLVKAGHNKDRTFREAHVVSSVLRLNRETVGEDGFAVFSASVLPNQAGMGCALLVQDGASGAVRTARYCPH